MLMVTLTLYRDAAQDTLKSLSTSVWAGAFLLAAGLAMLLVTMAMAPFGFVGGFVVGGVHIYLVGWYLSILNKVIGTRRLSLKQVKSAAGQLFWETMSVAFIFFIAQMVLRLGPLALTLVATFAAVVVFNPVPELLYLGRREGVELLQEAAKFMQNNWPEWIGAQLLVMGLLALLSRLAGPASPGMLAVVTMYGPFFGFIQAGSVAMGVAGTGIAGMISSLILVSISHLVMVFRGFLFKRLKGSSRRSRAWQRRAR